MAALCRIPNAATIAAVDAITALIGAGGFLRIYQSTGTPPTDAADVANGTLLAELALSATPFAGATAIGNKGSAAANTITADSSANASGTADYCRFVTSAGVCIIQDTVGTASAGLILNSVAISIGANVAVSSYVFRMPEYSGAV